MTVRKALWDLRSDPDADPEKVRARARAVYSESNGGLMRITPLAVYLSNIKDNTIFEYIVNSEVSLTHCNSLVQMAITAYCIALRELINGKDRIKAYKTAKYIKLNLDYGQ